MKLSIAADVRAVRRQLSDAARKQIPFAAAQAVNAIAFEVMDGENEAMARVFKHPKRWTKTAVQVQQKARKGNPTAIVSIRANRGYLQPYETGGVHILPGKALLNPKDVRLDQYGQLPRSTLKQLLGRSDVFVGTVRGVTGFWQRLPRAKQGRRALPNGVVRQQLRLLIRFGVALPVKQHLDFRKRAQLIVAAEAPGALRAALAKAMSTAK